MAFKDLLRKKSVPQILAENESGVHGHLSKHLGVRDLTAFGIAAIIGAGIFTTIGVVSAEGGPAVVFLFLFTAIACGFAAFAYAEFASMVPVSGSAYTYSYVAFGELVAWIIGWALIMEYAVGNITVAIGWSGYFTELLSRADIHLPAWMTIDYLSASKGFEEAKMLLDGGKPFEKLAPALQESYNAWSGSPTVGGFHLIADLPALLIIILITTLVYRGIKETRNASNAMVIIKVAVVLLVIAVGIFYIDTENWNPFAPEGVSGILKGVSGVFFAYIGFDAISTTAEECKNPQRDLPKGMMWAIIICTILYVLIALVLTGMVHYSELGVDDPLAFVFSKLELGWLSAIIAVSAVIAMASVLLVFQLGQPRIWMAMSRDGLLPKAFARVHPKFKTPSFSTVVVGFLVAVPSLFMNLTMVTDLCSIGTLFAFVLVCAGVLRLQNDPNVPRGKFRTPYFNGKFLLPILGIIAFILMLQFNADGMKAFFTNEKKQVNAGEFIANLDETQFKKLQSEIIKIDSAVFVETYYRDSEAWLNDRNETDYNKVIHSFNLGDDKLFVSGWDVFKTRIPMWIFLIVTFSIVILTVKHNLSTIPALGLISCLYMMAEIHLSNWIGFGIWLAVGLLIYFGYSRKHSRLRLQAQSTK